jgi:hypothetical protein
MATLGDVCASAPVQFLKSTERCNTIGWLTALCTLKSGSDYRQDSAFEMDAGHRHLLALARVLE